jgi:hypothetical protein
LDQTYNWFVHNYEFVSKYLRGICKSSLTSMKR